jgi:hypothetical protein
MSDLRNASRRRRPASASGRSLASGGRAYAHAVPGWRTRFTRRRQLVALIAVVLLALAAASSLSTSSSEAVSKAKAPFASSSPWNTPADPSRQLEPASGAMTSTLRRGGITSWMNIERYSHPVFEASESDPVVTITDSGHQADWAPGWTTHVEWKVPVSALPSEGTDGHLHIVSPDGTKVLETFVWKWTGPTSASVARMHVVDLEGSGIGPFNGTRAYGGSAIGGLIRTWEVDPSDPDYVDGVIRHALAIALPPSMLKYTGGLANYDAQGYGTAKGYVWPATEQDWCSPGCYKGPIPMGSYLAIPKGVDIDSLGLSPQARAIAQALQDYGAYVTDVVGEGTVAFYAEPSVPDAWSNTILGPSWKAEDLEAIRQQLVVASDSGSWRPSGEVDAPPTTEAPVAPVTTPTTTAPPASTTVPDTTPPSTVAPDPTTPTTFPPGVVTEEEFAEFRRQLAEWLVDYRREGA